MHQSEGALDPWVHKFGVKGSELGRSEHALVDDCAGAQRREVDAVVSLRGSAHGLVYVITTSGNPDLMFDSLAGNIGPAIEGNPREISSRDKDLTEGRHSHQGGRAKNRLVDLNVAPTNDVEAFLHQDLVHCGLGACGGLRILRQECNARCVCAHGRKVEGNHVTVETIRNLDQDACSITSVDICTLGTSVFHRTEGADALGHDVVAGTAMEVANKIYATAVVLVARVIQPLGLREITRHRGNRHRDVFLPTNVARGGQIGGGDVVGPASRSTQVIQVRVRSTSWLGGGP